MTSSSRRILAASTGIVLVAGALAACGPDDAPASLAEQQAASAAAAPSSSPAVSESPEDAATRLAEEALLEYYEVAAKMGQDPESFDPATLEDVTVGSALEYRQTVHAGQLALGRHDVGEVVLDEVAPVEVDLTLDAEDNVIPYVDFEVCYDLSGHDIVDADGVSVVPADRRVRGVDLVGVVNYDYPADDGWRVAYVENVEGETC